MSVTARRTPSGSWEVDLHVTLPSGRKHRERRRLRDHRHLLSSRVLCQDSGARLSPDRLCEMSPLPVLVSPASGP